VLFHGPVRVPDDAGTGKAKLTFSFDAWQGAGVRRSQTELPITEADAQSQATNK
jgi:hypothetical protein